MYFQTKQYESFYAYTLLTSKEVGDNHSHKYNIHNDDQQRWVEWSLKLMPSYEPQCTTN